MVNDTTNSTPVQDSIPEDVIEALAEVRECGETNMLDRNYVIKLVWEFDYVEAAAWLMDNKKRYMEALNAMGASR